MLLCEYLSHIPWLDHFLRANRPPLLVKLSLLGGPCCNHNAQDAQTDVQWPFQDPKLEVPTIYKAYVRPM